MSSAAQTRTRPPPYPNPQKMSSEMSFEEELRSVQKKALELDKKLKFGKSGRKMTVPCITSLSSLYRRAAATASTDQTLTHTHTQTYFLRSFVCFSIPSSKGGRETIENIVESVLPQT